MNWLSEIYREFVKTYFISFRETSERYPTLILDQSDADFSTLIGKIPQLFLTIAEKKYIFEIPRGQASKCGGAKPPLFPRKGIRELFHSESSHLSCKTAILLIQMAIPPQQFCNSVLPLASQYPFILIIITKNL